MRLHKVYIELVFMDNFIVNLLIILLASAFTKAKKKWGRYVLAAVIGGVYACVVFGVTGVFISLMFKVGISFLMCFVAYYSKGERGFLKSTCAFYITSFVFAGAIYAMMYSFGETATFGGSLVVRPFIRYILLGVAVGAILICIFSRVYKRTQQTEQLTVDISMKYGQRQTRVKAYLDTGNMVTEPLCGLGVIFASQTTAAALFDKDTLGLIQGHGGTQTDRFRVIPCTTAAGNSVFYGIEIDGVYLAGSKGQNDAKRKGFTRAVVCISKSTLAYGCGAIIGNTIFEELLKGAQNDKVFGAKNRSVDAGKDGDSGQCGLHQRERGAAAAAQPSGRSGLASDAGTGGCIGEKGVD